MVNDKLRLDDTHRHLQESQPARDFASGNLVGVEELLLAGLEQRVARPRYVLFEYELEDGGEMKKFYIVAVDKALVPCFFGIDRLDPHVCRCIEGRQGVANEPTREHLYVLNLQHVDVIKDVPVGAKVSVPVVDTSVDTRVGLHSSCSCCWHLHDVVNPELICSVFEEIGDFLGIHHGDREWFPSLLRLSGLGQLVLYSFVSTVNN